MGTNFLGETIGSPHILVVNANEGTQKRLAALREPGVLDVTFVGESDAVNHRVRALVIVADKTTLRSVVKAMKRGNRIIKKSSVFQNVALMTDQDAATRKKASVFAQRDVLASATGARLFSLSDDDQTLKDALIEYAELVPRG